MSNNKKAFIEFIVDASSESHLPPGLQKKLIRGFYEIVAQGSYTDSDLELYLEKQGYDAKPEDLKHIRYLHKTTEMYFPGVHNADY
jgi:hypothetical protein